MESMFQISINKGQGLPVKAFLPLVLTEVEMYFSQKGIPHAEAVDFYEHNKEINWSRKRGGWKKAAHQVIQRILRERPWLFERRTN